MSSTAASISIVEAWKGATEPNRKDVLKGRFVSLEPLSASHNSTLYHNLCQAPDADTTIWDFMKVMPKEKTQESFMNFMQDKTHPNSKAYFYSIIDNLNQESLGFLALDEIHLEYGIVEIGSVLFSKKIQRTSKGTEAIYLILKHCFNSLGFKRIEWRCDNGNERSKIAAKRYGFVFEGVLRKRVVVKGVRLDAAVFAILEDEWERIGKAFEYWLSEENMDSNGRQKERLKVSQTTLFSVGPLSVA